MKILFYKSKNFKNLKELDVVNLEVEVCQTELKEFALGAENFKFFPTVIILAKLLKIDFVELFEVL